jgi:hypothetical protein
MLKAPDVLDNSYVQQGHCFIPALTARRTVSFWRCMPE